MTQTRKLLVIDTSVMLYDPNSLKFFHGNDLIIPLIVLEELDRFKERKDQVGSAAREVNRFLDSLRKIGSLHAGVTVPNTDILIRVERVPVEDDATPPEFPIEKGDNKIVAVALAIKARHSDREVRVITKDINLRIKCDALGVRAEDYYTDIPKAYRDGSEGYTGQCAIEVSNRDVDDFYSSGEVTLFEPEVPLYENQLVVATSDLDPQKGFIGIYSKGKVHKPKMFMEQSIGVKPRSKEQTAALHLLTNKDIPLVSLTGLAGSGKTFLALVAGMSGLNSKLYDRIVITRSIEPVGRDLGFLPGSLEEKMAPWLMPIVDNFRSAFHDPSYFELMRQKGSIEISPVSYIRGRSFNNCYVIVDESQNLTIHEIKTIVTRCGAGTKIVLLGDTDQVDTPYLDRHSNGLAIAIEKLKGNELFGHIKLDRGERSPLATLASREL